MMTIGQRSELQRTGIPRVIPVLRKISKTRGVFPDTNSLLKLFYMGLQRAAQKWTLPITDWRAALNRFAIEFEDRLPRRL
jgi:putative transposase